MTILDEILAHKREEVARLRQAVPLSAMQAKAGRAIPPRDIVEALRDSPARPALIAEVKRASPSRGLLAAHLDPLNLALTYQQNGAAVISVLTDQRYFQGSLAHLTAIRQEVRLPVLRKDFVFDPYQVYEARAAGADAILLIVAMLSDEDMLTLHHLTHQLGMTALIEVHDEAELKRALRVRPRLLGVNNRDLRTFRVDLGTTARLRPLVPHDVTLVAESGVHTAADAARLAALGVDAMLVGEALVTAADVAGRVRELTQSTLDGTPRVKICGITALDDARAAVKAGADMLGFNFYEPSPRFVRPANCAQIVAALRDDGVPVVTVGVFVNAPASTISHVMDDCGLDLAQLHGDEPAESLAALGERAFKAIRPATPAAAQTAAQQYTHRATPPVLLVDAFHPNAYGGTGHTGNWALAAELARQVPLLLAGGLCPENVAGAIAQVQPWGVDVASGVESSPGRKDHAQMRSFVQAVSGCPKR